MEQSEGHDATSTGMALSRFLHVSVVDDTLLERISEMIAEGRAEASQFKLIVGCVVWKKAQLASEWDRNYWYGAESNAVQAANLAMTQLSTQYANRTLDGTVENIPRAGALLKMRRMIGAETMHKMLFDAPSPVKREMEGIVDNMLTEFIAGRNEGFDKSKLGLVFLSDDSPQKEKAAVELFVEFIRGNSVPFFLQKDLYEKTPSEVMADPDSTHTNNLSPSISWDRLLKLSVDDTSSPRNLKRTRWDIVAESLGVSSGCEDMPICDESVWAELLHGMEGEYASLDSLASVLDAQIDLYNSKREDSDNE